MKNTVRIEVPGGRLVAVASSEINKKHHSRDCERILLTICCCYSPNVYSIDSAGRPVKAFVRFKDTFPLGNRQAWIRNPICKAFTGRACHSYAA